MRLWELPSLFRRLSLCTGEPSTLLEIGCRVTGLRENIPFPPQDVYTYFSFPAEIYHFCVIDIALHILFNK